MQDIEVFNDIKAFIEDKGLKGQGTIDPDTPLLEWGILDSLTLARLTAHVEVRFGITIPSGINLGERFRNLQNICDFVAELRSGQESGGAAAGSPARPAAGQDGPVPT